MFRLVQFVILIATVNQYILRWDCVLQFITEISDSSNAPTQNIQRTNASVHILKNQIKPPSSTTFRYLCLSCTTYYVTTREERTPNQNSALCGMHRCETNESPSQTITIICDSASELAIMAREQWECQSEVTGIGRGSLGRCDWLTFVRGRSEGFVLSPTT